MLCDFDASTSYAIFLPLTSCAMRQRFYVQEGEGEERGKRERSRGKTSGNDDSARCQIHAKIHHLAKSKAPFYRAYAHSMRTRYVRSFNFYLIPITFEFIIELHFLTRKQLSYYLQHLISKDKDYHVIS